MSTTSTQSMTPEQFFDVDGVEQAEETWEGTHLGNREDEEHNILLYELDDMYVKVFVHKNTRSSGNLKHLRRWSCWIFTRQQSKLNQFSSSFCLTCFKGAIHSKNGK